jgi:hypothetical protein
MTVEGFSYIPAADLPAPRLARAQHMALDAALKLDSSVILLGTMPDELERVIICTCGCARGAAGSMVVVPDLLVLEGIAEGCSEAGHQTLTRRDGRSGMIMREWTGG